MEEYVRKRKQDRERNRLKILSEKTLQKNKKIEYEMQTASLQKLWEEKCKTK